jgi:hypothetical protein
MSERDLLPASREISRMMRIANPLAGLVRGLSLAATAVLMLAAAPGKPAQAMSLVTPSAAPSAKYAVEGLMTQVHGGGHGGGGGFHGGGGGGFHGGGGGFHSFGGGGFHGGGFHGGGIRYGGFHHGGFRFAHHHFHRHFFYGGYYPYYYDDYYPYHRCRIIRTYYGLRRVCHWHRWHHRHYY